MVAERGWLASQGDCMGAGRCLVIGAAVVALLVAFPACSLAAQAGGGQGASEAPAEPIVKGRAVFEQKACARCHGIWGDGPRIGPDLGSRGSSWRDVMWFAGSLWNHNPAMSEKMRKLEIERPTLSPDEVRELAAYLFYVKFLGRPGEVDEGGKVFEQALCSRCHQLGGRGGTVGPRLDDLRGDMSLYFLARALWNHGPAMAKKMSELNLVRPYLEGDDVRHLVAFLHGKKPAFGPLEIAHVRAGTPRVGEVLFREKGCTRCHAVAGEGGKTGPDLGRQRLWMDLADIAAALWNHGPSMWAKMEEMGIQFPELTDQELSHIVSYLAFIQYLGPAGDVARGREVFRTKSCSQCHAIRGEGPRVGPDLAASDASQSPLTWTSALWNHASAMEKVLKEKHVAWPRFEGDEMRDLVAFLRSVRTAK